MSELYTKAVLTLIAAALCAITAKLYLPAANRIGPHIGSPTRYDLFMLKDMKDGDQRNSSLKQIKLDVPLNWIDGGNVDVSGSVSIDGPVSIDP